MPSRIIPVCPRVGETRQPTLYSFFSIKAPFFTLPVTSTDLAESIKLTAGKSLPPFSRSAYKCQSLKTGTNLPWNLLDSQEHLRCFSSRGNRHVRRCHPGMLFRSPDEVLIITCWTTVLCFIYSWPWLELPIFFLTLSFFLNMLMLFLTLSVVVGFKGPGKPWHLFPAYCFL